LNQETYRNIVSGRASGPRAAILRGLLTVLSWPYGAIVRLRNGLYSAGVLKTHGVSAAVISVGNLTVGGTGKTPLVVWLCRIVQQRQRRCAILTRGYRTERGTLSDEPALLAARCPGVSIIVDPDRVAGAKQAISECDAEVLILDDGFQHRRLGRDLNIVAIDATLPFGYGRMLPAGLLREPVAGLRRADAAVITRCDQVSEEKLARIEERIRQINPQAVISRAIHAPVGATAQTGSEIGLERLRGKRAYAFCGLGNPEAFFDTIRRLGGVLAGYRCFDDHYRYTRDCLGEIRLQAVEKGVDYVVTTQKDWTKIAPLVSPEDSPPMVYVVVEMSFTTAADLLIGLIDHVLGGTIPRKSER
jgi:tetraacyldisaccharide 4'-kinase